MDFLNNDDSDDGNSFKINQDYAKRYDKWRKSEELQKCKCSFHYLKSDSYFLCHFLVKDKYGENYNEDDSTSEEEDENAVVRIFLSCQLIIKFQIFFLGTY